MARKRDSQLSLAEQELLKQFQASLAGRSADELRELLPQILGTAMSQGPPGLDPFSRSSPPSRRRARRKNVATYQVRVDLMDTKPPVWRRLELDSDLYLNEVHDILQTAFGWTDSHLHEFASGKDFNHRLAEHYLCPFQVDEGETGVPEEDVRLDEVLARPGDKLLYLYDFSNDWMHVLKLEAERPRDDSAPGAVCIDGRRPAPSEDCGGVDGYELISAALDPGHPEHAEAVAEYAHRYGEDVNPAGWAPTPFDIERINKTLAEPSDGDLVDLGAGPSGFPGPIGELAEAIRFKAPRDLFQQLIEDADLESPVEIDAGTAAMMVSPYRWLLDRVGADGIKLTGAGYLPPVHVEAAMADLALGDEWISKGNREVQTMPVLHLRESAQAMGLLRKHRGTLLLTKRGQSVRNDPLALWWHLAEQMPQASKESYETQARLILLAVLAAQSNEDPDNTIAEILTAIGWRTSDGSPMTSWTASQAVWDTNMVLSRLGAFDIDRGISRWTEKPTPQCVAFARAALTTWPGSSA